MVSRITASSRFTNCIDFVDSSYRYGDYLYEQGNYDDAVVEYIKTIGVFEPSYVIRKFLDAQRLPCLTEYLEAVHKQGLANKEHTTLLINCYCKMHQRDKLQEFIYTNSRGLI